MVKCCRSKSKGAKRDDNDEMDVHHNLGGGYFSTSRCESPDVVIHCGLCFRSSVCDALRFRENWL